MKYVVCLLVALAALPAAAETVWSEAEGDDSRVVRIVADAADAPWPLLKHRLELQPSKTTHGNAAADYRRAFAENTTRGAWQEVRDMFAEDKLDGEPLAERLYSSDIPLHELPADKLRAIAGRFDSIIEGFVGPGTSRRRCDWELPTLDLSGPKLIALLLPEIQEMRSLSRAVALQTRHALVEGDYQRAIDLMRMNYTMGRDTAREPLLVCSLVGMAICGMASENMFDLIGAPDSPNMYWALTTLPTPLVPINEAIQVEMELGKRVLPALLDVQSADYSYDEWNTHWKKGARIFEEWHLYTDRSEAPAILDFAPVAFGLGGYTHAKARLVAWGYEPAVVEAMAVGQVLSLYSSRVYHDITDRMEVAHCVPFPESRALVAAVETELQQRGPLSNHPDRELIPIASLLLPAVGSARGAEVRVDRTIAALRVIEALRMHAAQNDGALPKSLDEVTCVPIPMNPATGKPFEYELKTLDDKPTAVLTLPKTDGVLPPTRIELTIRSTGS